MQSSILRIAAIPSSQIPYVIISIDDKGLVALWDSGASVTYVSLSTAYHVGVEIKGSRPRNAKTANGSSFEFVGSFTAPVRIADIMVEYEFLVAPDHCCPGNALLGFDFMEFLDRKNIQWNLRPSKGQLIIDGKPISIVGPRKNAFPSTNALMEVLCAEDVIIDPGQEHIIQIANAEDTKDDEAVLLKSSPNAPLLFEKTIFHPLEARGTALRVRNVTTETIHFKEGDIVGKGTIVQLADLPKPEEPTIPAEANWEDRVFDPKSIKFLEKLKIDGPTLTQQMKDQLLDVIKNNSRSFFNEDAEIGLFNGGVEHRIELRQDLPFPKSRTYRVPLGNQQEVERQVQEMLKMGIIEPSTSTFLSPIVLVRKKDRSYRFTTDFRLLNAVTVKQNYLLPHITDIVNLAAGGKYFSNLDLVQGFFQIPLRKSDRALTSFATPSGTFQYRRMPMGLCGAPHTFQTAVRQLQMRVKAKLFCYLDDLLIVSETFEQHLEDLNEVFVQIAAIGFKIKAEKCAFAQIEVTFLGLLVGRNGIKPNPVKIQAIMDFPIPQSPTGVRSFLGITNYFRKFIFHYANIAEPLQKLTRKDEKFVWTKEQDDAFEKLKKSLCSAPVLHPPVAGKPFVIESDASSIAVGALLLQEGDDKELHPIAYASRKLNGAERRYPPIETEALALVFATSQFRTYILGSAVTAIVDHRPLTSLMHRRDLIGRLAKYQIILQELDLKIVYRPGRLNSVCDALSRYIGKEIKEARSSTKKEEDFQVNATEVTPSLYSPEEIEKIQKDHLWIQRIMTEFGDGEPSVTEKYAVTNGILYVKKNNEKEVIVIPEDSSITSSIVRHFHETPHLGAHAGVKQTQDLISQRFHWRSMQRDIRKVVQSCQQCIRRKVNPHQETKEPMGSLSKLSRPWERIHSDICGPFPITASGNRYMLTVKDDFTKYVVAIPIETQHAKVIAKALIEQVFLKFGTPEIMITDNGSNFTSELMKEVLTTLRIDHSTTAPYHKMSNGSIERVHRVLEEKLAAYVNGTQTDWDAKLQYIVFAINSIPHATTKVSPNHALYGRELRTPEDIHLGMPTAQYADVEDFHNQMRTHLRDLHEEMRQQIEMEGEKRKQQYAERHRTLERDVRVGSKIFVRRSPPRNKLAPRLHGPFTVIGTDEFNVEYKDGKKKKKANKNDVRVFVEDDQEVEMQVKDAESSEEMSTEAGKLKEAVRREKLEQEAVRKEKLSQAVRKEKLSQAVRKEKLTPRRSERIRNKGK